MVLDHSKLTVYQRALDLLELCDAIAESLPPGRAHLKDQFDRAATSVVLNIAEGAGEFRAPEKQRFYRMAKRSGTEAAAVLDILARRRLISAEQHAASIGLIVEVVSMLTRMATRALERTGEG